MQFAVSSASLVLSSLLHCLRGSSAVLGGPPAVGDKIFTTIVMEPFALFFGFGDSLAGICGFGRRIRGPDARMYCGCLPYMGHACNFCEEEGAKSHTYCPRHIVLLCICNIEVCLPFPKDVHLVWTILFRVV